MQNILKGSPIPHARLLPTPRNNGHQLENWFGHAANSTIIFFNQSQLVLYRLLFISFGLFFTGHWNPETLEPRVEAPGHWNLGTLEPRASVCLSRSTPRLISTFSRVILRLHGCESNASFTQESGCEINATHTQGSGCDINASHTQGSGCEINASHSTSRRHLVMDRPRASRSSSHCDERWEGCRV